MNKILTALVVAMLLSGCDAAVGESAAMGLIQTSPAAPVEASLDRASPPATKPVTKDQPTRTQPSTAGPTLSEPNPKALPPDGKLYQYHQKELKQAEASKQPGRLVGIPTEYLEGDPVYPATCLFYPDHAECTLESGEIVDEDYLVAHTTVLRNVDVLGKGLTCGKICVDNDGRVLGHVSKEMIAWRDRHCTWEEYGNSKCN